MRKEKQTDSQRLYAPCLQPGGVYYTDGERGLQGSLGKVSKEYHLYHAEWLAVPGPSAVR